MSFEARAYVAIIAAMLAAMVVPIAGFMVYEHRHPCLRYSTHRVFVEELTTYISIDTERGIMVPMTTPAHYEDETVCEERK